MRKKTLVKRRKKRIREARKRAIIDEITWELGVSRWYDVTRDFSFNDPKLVVTEYNMS